ncbi:DUF4167 domain-containing protein [Roseobacter sp. HKCCD9010]|uniref:DUF4167 domain-containing protein n=1 Tax=unclassified Roseobacter TaxID=196798 RepID=UPI001491CB05|nr:MULTISPECIES: DUF4167 domain-containing protein [unclassified Roseobacter]MBF9050799.1 DUF4167 domain-containing protein [Rhodobacterales bacterium HKCCD4356]NNV11783.1 DUF4167 domain-containing protein [Roseobacter sp. HKCCD7357]NNV17934.1 DUF4167 domain-containing protein [Roseobacter sp. HKCCD8768]NNV26025.1 DUF4167 domain-containing protein [Roseobacter sp. HKCCD8192]NNV31661.1 DUF4167 domain-containing protein [Roseobacter sp. HKCCD9061]
MRSSKNRSRSKGNRNRSVGNIVNRVFDSSGPEGKVRGTPQQIIDKYNQLARDAQLSNDRVATENFQQHAEHYTRMLSEAQREMEAKREAQEAQQNQQREQRQQNQQRHDEAAQQNQQRADDSAAQNTKPAASAPQPELQPGEGAQPDASFDAVIDAAPEGDSGLVETPESAPKPKRSRTRRPRKAEAETDSPPAEPTPDNPQEAAE